MLTDTKRLLLVLVPLLPAAAILVAPMPLAPAAHRALAIAVFMIAGWLLEPINPAFYGLAGCLLFWSVAGVRFEAAFHGFLTVTPWFLYGAIILGVTAEETGLARFLAGLLPRAVRNSFPRALLIFVVLGYILGLLLPSAIASALIISVLALGVARARQDGAGYWLLLAAGYAAALFGPSIVLAGAILPELPWTMAAAAVCCLLVWRWSRSSTQPNLRVPHPERSEVEAFGERERGEGRAGVRRRNPDAERSEAEGAPQADALKVGALLGIALILWLTVSRHGVSPALVGLGAGLMAFVPGVGPKLGPRAQKPDPLAIILAGAALSLPAVLARTGALPALEAAFLAMARALAPIFPAKLSFYWTALGYHLFVPETAKETLPWVGQLAQASGLKGSGTAIWSASESAKLSLYQSPALILAASLGGLRGRDVLKLGLAVAVLGSVAILLLPA